jgi:hypothetical protein
MIDFRLILDNWQTAHELPIETIQALNPDEFYALIAQFNEGFVIQEYIVKAKRFANDEYVDYFGIIGVLTGILDRASGKEHCDSDQLKSDQLNLAYAKRWVNRAHHVSTGAWNVFVTDNIAPIYTDKEKEHFENLLRDNWSSYKAFQYAQQLNRV